MTGLGMVSPLGNDVETSWQNLIAGKSGAAKIEQFDTDEFPVHFACELKDFDPTLWIDRKQARRMDRFAQMVLAAARQAEADSGLEIAGEADRVGAAIATGIGGLGAFQDCYQTLIERGPDRVNPFSIPAIIPNMGAGWVSMELGTRGPLSSQCTACAASNMAIGEGADAIRLGRADVMLCGGTEAGITRVGIAGFGAMRALSRRNERSGASLAPLRRGPRRLRDGRGRRRGRARGAGARARARREGLCGADRLRRLLRREPHHRARSVGREPRARDEDGVRRRGDRAVARSATSTRTAPRRRSATRPRRG